MLLMLANMGIMVMPQYSIRKTDDFIMIPLNVHHLLPPGKIDYEMTWHKEHDHNHAEEFASIVSDVYKNLQTKEQIIASWERKKQMLN